MQTVTSFPGVVLGNGEERVRLAGLTGMISDSFLILCCAR